MNQTITPKTLPSFAYTNRSLIPDRVRGVAVEFIGLGDSRMLGEDYEIGARMAKDGILWIHPYVNPWAWMNPQTVAFVDQLVELVFEALSLPEDTPIVITGGSMGGQQALTYTAYAKRPIAACVVNCPVCDLVYHYTERPDLPRTLVSAFGADPDGVMAGIEKASPLHLVPRFPQTVKYTVFHCTEDKAVNKEKHSDRLVAAMKDSFDLTYHVIEGRGHCDLTDEGWGLYRAAILDARH